MVQAGIDQKSRLIVLSDLENEPDDTQSMVKLMLYANEVDIEGLIAVTSRWLQNTVYPETIENIINAYGIVRPKLCRHAMGYPTREALMKVVAGGQTGFGMKGVGDHLCSEGARLIIEVVDKPDPRPVYIAINAGSNTLAQAVWEVMHSRSAAETDAFIRKLRVYDDSGQDNAGAWLCHTFPQLFYARSRAQVFGLFGPTASSGPEPWLPLDQWDWVEQNVRTRHGLLGALYPQRIFKERLYEFMEGGNTTTWLGLVNRGLYDPEHVNWGGWGGRMSLQKEQVSAGQYQVDEMEKSYIPFAMYPQADDWSWQHDKGESWNAFSGLRGKVDYTVNTFAPLWRWRDAYTRDFKARMDWCVTDYGQANHPPHAIVEGDATRAILFGKAKPGDVITLNASDSFDPDGDELSFHWLDYPEAGTYGQSVSMSNTETAVVTVDIPHDAAGTEIHVILELTDRHGEVPMTSYRRVVLTIGGEK